MGEASQALDSCMAGVPDKKIHRNLFDHFRHRDEYVLDIRNLKSVTLF